MERSVKTDTATLCYTLTRKAVKNLNLRVRRDGSVAVSAPSRVPLAEVDAFVRRRADWIFAAQSRLAAEHGTDTLPPCTYTDAECEAVFLPLLLQYFPYFEKTLGGRLPELRYRTMKSRWGVCYPTKRKITLNRRLLDKPAAAIEYVVLHELVHFHHPNHGKGFYAELAQLMPDYKARKTPLRHL